MGVTDFRCGFRRTQRNKFIKKVTNAMVRKTAVCVLALAVQAHALTDSMVGALEGGSQGLFLYLPEGGAAS